MTTRTSNRPPHCEAATDRPIDQSVTTELQRWMELSGAELHLGDRRAWVIVVGTVDADRAHAIVGLVDELAWQPSLHRISVDLTCTVMSDGDAAAACDALLVSAAPWVDMATPGPIAWRIREHRPA